MDTSLERHADSTNIWQVSGWFPPNHGPRHIVGCLQLPGCWGWATWKRSWDQYCDDAKYLYDRIVPDHNVRFDLDGSYDFSGALQRNSAGTQNTWHVRWYASMFLHNALAIHPQVSLTRNIGFDSRGTNCKPNRASRALMNQIVNRSLPDISTLNNPVTESAGMRAQMIAFFRWQQRMWSTPSLTERLKSRILRLLRKKGEIS
jgi:hypothetical protein